MMQPDERETGRDRAGSAGQQRARLDLLLRTLKRETRASLWAPDALASHLHNVLFLDQGEGGLSGLLLRRAREALADRIWLRLGNRPQVERSALLEVLDQQSPISHIAWSPDGRTIAGGGRDLRLWDAATGNERTTLIEGGDVLSPWVSGLVWSPDGFLLAVGHGRFVWLWDANSESLRPEPREDDSVHVLAWSPDGALLALAPGFGRLELWDVTAGQLRAPLAPHANSAMTCAFSPDGSLLACNGRDPQAHQVVGVWATDSGQQVAELRHQEVVGALAWSPDGRTLASASGDGTIRLWDLDRAKEPVVRLRLRANTYSLSHGGMAWSPDGRVLAWCSENSVRLWDPERWSEPTVLVGHSAKAAHVAWSPDGRTLASGGNDGTMRLWDPERLQEEEEEAVPASHTSRVAGEAWSPDGTLLASEGRDGIRLWDVGGAQRGLLEPGTSPFAWCPGGGRLAFSREGFDVSVWDTATADVLVSWPTGRLEREGLAWSRDGRLLAAPGPDGTVIVWDASTRELRAATKKDRGWVTELAWSPDGLWLATATVSKSGDGASIHVWDPKRRKRKTSLPGSMSSVESLKWSPDGTLLAAVGSVPVARLGPIRIDRVGGVRIWDVSRAREECLITEDRGSVKDAAWSPNGAFLAWAASHAQMASTGGVGLWDRGKRGVVVLSDEPSSRVSWSPESAVLLSAPTHDSTLRLWDPIAVEQLAVLEGHRGWVTDEAWTDDGRLLATSSMDGTVRLWQIPSGRCLAVAFCLSPTGAVQLSVDGTVLQVADNGAATGNRPIPYVFDVSNFDIATAIGQR